MSNEESAPKPYKFGYFPRPDVEMPFEYSDVWCRGKTSGPDRLVIAASKSQVDLMVELCSLMPEPYFVLYVLVVPCHGVIRTQGVTKARIRFRARLYQRS
jgi:hypothetical protein